MPFVVTNPIEDTLTTINPVESNDLGGAASEARVTLRGTHAGFQLFFEGTEDGTNWDEVATVEEKNLAPVAQPYALATNATKAFLLRCPGMKYVRVRASASTSGSPTARVSAGWNYPQSFNALQTTGGISPLAKLDLAALVAKAAAGRNGAGAITVTGTTVGQRVLFVFGAPTAGGALEVRIPGTDFESIVSVAGQIQQLSAANLTANTYAFYLGPALV